MEVILLEDLRKVGRKGDTVTLKDGYARNLIAKKQAAELNAKTLNDMKLQKKHEEKVAEEKLKNARDLKEKLAGTVIRVPVKVGKDGKLFGSVSTKEIAEAFKAEFGLDVDKKKIVLSESIKELGRKEIPVKLHPEVQAVLVVEVVEA